MAKYRLLHTVCLLTQLSVLAACAEVPPDSGAAAAQPTAYPAKQVTRYSGAAACVRRQLAKVPGHAQFVTVGLIPDATGRITPGIREMVSAAVVSATSGSSRYIPTEAATIAGLA